MVLHMVYKHLHILGHMDMLRGKNEHHILWI